MRCPSGFNRCISANYASECNNHLYLTAGAKCESTCPDGFYRSPINGKPIGRECPRCPEDCNKCEDADACSECKNSKYLNPDLWCETECPTGYYKVGNGEIGNTCEKCPEHCRNCVDSQTCTECMDFKYLAPSRQCVETCPTNTFHLGDGEAGRVCAYCEKGCHSCATSTRCLECNSSLHLDEVFNCVEVCPDGFYPEGDEDRGRSCLSCPTYCSICSGPDVCLECNVFRYLNPDSSCRPECPDGFYRLGSGIRTGGTCPRCFHTCNKCDSADVCTECKNFTYLTPDSKCNYECPAGYWESGTEEIGGTCERCSDNCMECTSAEVCEVCQNGYFLDISSSTCKKECPPGFWGKIPDPKVETGRTCEICSWPCNKCDSAKICTECRDSSYLTPFETCEYTCPPGYYPDGIGEINVTCQPCSENCATCDTFEVCTACKNEKYLNPDGSCQDFCPDGYWELPAAGGVGNACPLCAENCSLCTSATVCQECRNSTYLTHYDWCEVTCQDGWYHEGIEDIGRHCKACDPTCNKCEAEDYCTECKSSLYLTSRHLCEKTCPKGFYANRTRAVGGECETCPEQCTQCTSASTCSECRNGLFLTPDGFCEDGCPTGHWAKVGDPFGVGGTCPMCPENCHACNNLEECTVCRHFTHLTAYGQCRSECPAGYYENGTANIGGNCNRCPSPCNLCETATVCTECAEASYLTHTGTCSYKCPDGYHYEGTEEIGRFCKICPPTCVTCLGQGQCTLCQNYTYLTPDQTCEYTCPDGHYRQGIAETGNTCPACPGDMERCINTTYATECKNKRYLTPAAKCEEGCPDGFYRFGAGEVGRSCPRCSTNCTLCSNATTCHECQNGQYLTHTNWCDHECPDGYYKFGEGDVGRICKACKAPCNTCLGPDWCTECKQGMFLTPKGTCELSCPDGYWASVGANGVGGTCAICPENCAECKTETACTVCTNNTYLHANECKDRCPDGWFHLGEDISSRECISCKPGCSQCSNQTWCSECKDGLFLTANGQCESTCPEGFFNLPGTDGIGGVCQLCAEICTKCEWWDQCLECKASKYLTHYKWCTKACPAGYFEDGEGEVGRVCVACPDNCNTCENSLHCTECKNNSYLTPMKQCEGECPNAFFHEGFREVGRTCQACSANCNQCLSATECLECKGNAYLTEEQDCAASCPKGYYGQGEHIIGNTCQKCSKDCEECDGLELCTTCANSTFLTDSKYCAGECTTGFIQTGDTASGRVCEELCFWCNGGSELCDGDEEHVGLGRGRRNLQLIAVIAPRFSFQAYRETWGARKCFCPPWRGDHCFVTNMDWDEECSPHKSHGSALRQVEGMIMLAGCLLLWVFSSAAVQVIATDVFRFQQPLFVTLFNSVVGIILLWPYLPCRSQDQKGGSKPLHLDDVTLTATARMSCSVGVLWVCSQCMYNVSLLHTSVATNTVLSSTSSVFTFLFSLLLTGSKFRRWFGFKRVAHLTETIPDREQAKVGSAQFLSLWDCPCRRFPHELVVNMAAFSSPSPAAIAELIPTSNSEVLQKATRPSRRLHSAPRVDASNAMRRWPLPCTAEPRLLARPVPPRKISSSLPALTGWPTRASRSKSLGRLRSGSVPLADKPRQETFHGALGRLDVGDRLGRSPEPKAAEDAAELNEDPGSPTSPTGHEARFHLELKRVSSEVNEVRRRQLSTRRHLEQVKRELSSDSDINLKAIADFQAKVRAIEAEVSDLLGSFMHEWDTFNPVSEELQALASETDALTETDQRMNELLERMSRQPCRSWISLTKPWAATCSAGVDRPHLEVDVLH
eukprot:s1502_g6.t1